jgi:hypothetical protein
MHSNSAHIWCQRFVSFSVHGIDESRVVDPHRYNADPGPDPHFYFNADPDPTFHFHADPGPPQLDAYSRPLIYGPSTAPF